MNLIPNRIDNIYGSEYHPLRNKTQGKEVTVGDLIDGDIIYMKHEKSNMEGWWIYSSNDIGVGTFLNCKVIYQIKGKDEHNSYCNFLLSGNIKITCIGNIIDYPELVL